MYWLVYIDLPTTSARELLRLKALSDGRRWILSTNKKKRHRIRCRQRRPIHLCAAFISLVFFYRSLKTPRWDHKYVDRVLSQVICRHERNTYKERNRANAAYSISLQPHKRALHGCETKISKPRVYKTKESLREQRWMAATRFRRQRL